MNPVDHVSITVYLDDRANTDTLSLTVVVTTSTLVKPRQSPDTPQPVKRLVSLLPAALVSCVVPKRSRIRFLNLLNEVSKIAPFLMIKISDTLADVLDGKRYGRIVT